MHDTVKPAAPAAVEPRSWALVWALATAQLVSWGILYYGFSLFVVPMESELGWSRTALNGALSLGTTWNCRQALIPAPIGLLTSQVDYTTGLEFVMGAPHFLVAEAQYARHQDIDAGS